MVSQSLVEVNEVSSRLDDITDGGFGRHFLHGVHVEQSAQRLSKKLLTVVCDAEDHAEDLGNPVILRERIPILQREEVL
jgi:hypothetical protein